MSLISKYGRLILRFGLVNWNDSTEPIPVELDWAWEGTKPPISLFMFVVLPHLSQILIGYPSLRKIM